ncbi:MAG: hypothetical protein ACJ77K_19565 [Bacteroidia bacterium]
MRKFYFLAIFIPLISLRSVAQVSVKDSSVFIPHVAIAYGYQIAGGDLARRFGNNNKIQANLDFKMKSGWMLGVNGSYIFGKDVKESIFDSISTSNGGIIGKNGQFADVRLFERGFTVAVTAGRMFSWKKPNPNTGLVFNVGIGLIEHKIRIETIGNNVPQLSKEYKKGYDRLSNGLLLTQDLGYLYFSSNRLVNIYFGLECMEGFTQNRRSYNYDTMTKDTEKRTDILYGARIAWILPLYKRAPQEFYTY